MEKGRRRFLAVAGVGAAAAAIGVRPKTADEVRVVARDAEQWWGPGCRILTADGRDITALVPIQYVADFERSYRRHQPIEVDLFVRDADGRFVLTNDRKAIQRQRVTLLVTAFERASG